MTLFTFAKLVPGKKPGEEQTLFIESPYGNYTITEKQLIDLLIEDNQMCEHCLDEGEISEDESDGEGHIMRGVGSRRCICKEPDHDADEDRDEEEDLSSSQ